MILEQIYNNYNSEELIIINITRGSCPGRGMSCCKQVQSVPLPLICAVRQQTKQVQYVLNMQQSGISTFQTNCGAQRVLPIDQG